MPDTWTLNTPDGPYVLNPTFSAPQYQPGSVAGPGALRRDERNTYQRSGDGLPTPGPLVLTGRVWRDDQDQALILAELNAIRAAVAVCTSVTRENNAGTYTYDRLAGGATPEITSDGLGGWLVTLTLWPGRAEPTHLPPIAVTPDGIWLESLNVNQPDGTPITTWLDASAAEYHMTALDTHTPTFRHNQTPTGAPALETTADLSRLIGPHRWMTDGTEHFTCFIVAATTHTTFGGLLSNISNPGTGVDQGFHLTWPTNAELNYSMRFDNGNAVWVDFAQNKNDGDFHIFCLTRGEPAASGGQGFRTFVDAQPDAGLPSLSGVLTGNIPLALFGSPVHTTSSFRGLTAAVLWFREELSDPDRTRIHDYLRNRYIGSG